ncbi:hypothetical protein PRIPAC_91500 [Pristionchus pacificus]|uniref:Cullin domain-containing protein n=1 Tax=Pristionchus pacificus TaxID=54126 RepID=A0A2A6BAQ4_PRIPA|nr:hypothetical protein PRIPAC_91500 [Pristionchus pacificus]|eukprot:PDM62921.1 hypothetical protein PRIPAC_50136 [Pristionchus pacificus]
MRNVVYEMNVSGAEEQLTTGWQPCLRVQHVVLSWTYRGIGKIILQSLKLSQNPCPTCSRGDDQITSFAEQWNHFKLCSEKITGIFAYLNRHWIKRQMDSGNNEVQEIYTLAIGTWKVMMRQFMSTTIADAVREMIEEKNRGIDINEEMLKGVEDCFEHLGIGEISQTTGSFILCDV